MFMRPIAVELGDRECRVVQLERRRAGWRVGGLAAREVAADEDGAWIEAIAAALGGRRFSSRQAIVSLPAGDVVTFPIRFECEKNESVEVALAREVARRLPFPVEEAVVDCPSLVSSEPGDNARAHKAIIVAVRRSVLDRYLSLLQRGGVRAEVVDCDVSAMLRLHEFLFGPIRAPAVLCHIGSMHSRLAVVGGDRIFAHRNVAWGTELPVRKLLDNLQLTHGRQDALFLLRTHGLIHEADGEKAGGAKSVHDSVTRTVDQLVAPTVEELVHECHSISGYVRSEERDVVFNRLFLYGDAWRIKNLDRYIGSQVGLTVELADPTTKMETDGGWPTDHEEAASFALATGLAMRKTSWL